MNPYLTRLRERYEGLRTGIEGLQNRAAEEGRDLTEDELRSVKEQGDQAKTLATQIEDLTEVENRNRKVAELAAQVAGGDEGKPAEQTRSLGIKAQERDPGHYRSEKDGGEHSFFADLYRSRVESNEDAARRLTEHNRALSTGINGPGVVPPHWLTQEFELLPRQGRALANAVRSIPLGDDPRPITLPRQIVGTDAAVTDQANENDALATADDWDSDTETVTPKPLAGKQTLSRQMFDMSSPAVDMLLYGDLLSVYNTKVEAKVGAAVLATGTPIDGGVFADFDADVAPGLVIDAALAVRNARKLPADILAMEVNMYGRFLKLKDTTGRPLMPTPGPGQAVNVVGVGSVAVDGVMEGLGIVATDGMDDGVANSETFAALRAADVVLFESNVLRFQYDQVAGPQSIVLGIWGYVAVKVRQGTKSVKNVNLTLAP